MLIISIIVLPLSGSVRRGTKAALCDQLFELSSSHCYLGLASLAAHLNGSDSIDWNHVPLGRTVVSYDQLLWMKKNLRTVSVSAGFSLQKIMFSLRKAECKVPLPFACERMLLAIDCLSWVPDRRGLHTDRLEKTSCNEVKHSWHMQHHATTCWMSS